ncbi:hypothetical protein SAMN04244547_00981 [Azotobacter vinelandii]|nr:hypothetical protein SAMN04244547_00981 [Azotobacter vinelandii]
MRGQRTIWDERAEVRRILYMATRCAERHNPVLRDDYPSLLAAGKRGKVVLVATMRKLPAIINAMARRCGRLIALEFQDGCSIPPMLELDAEVRTVAVAAEDAGIGERRSGGHLVGSPLRLLVPEGIGVVEANFRAVQEPRPLR